MRNLYKPALLGLAKFSHLINIEFHSDLFKNFIKCLKDTSFTDIEKLQVAKTASILLKGEGESLNIDCHNLLLFTYQQITKYELNSLKHYELIFDLIEDLILKRRRSVHSRIVCYFTSNLLLTSIDLMNLIKKTAGSQDHYQNQQVVISILAMVRKILAAFGMTASFILDQTALEKAIEIDRNELPVVAKPTTICIVKELNLMQSKSQFLLTKYPEKYKLLNKFVYSLVADIRNIGKRATGQKTVVDEEGQEISTNTSNVEIAGRNDRLWLSSDAEQMISISGELLFGENFGKAEVKVEA